MQKLVVAVFSLAFLLSQPQQKTDSNIPPNLEVLKFSWTRYHDVPLTKTGLERTIPETRPRGLGEGIENRNSLMENRNSVEIQSRAMHDYEDKVAKESRKPNLANLFRYRVQLRNSGAKTIKTVYIDYQIIDPSDPGDPSHRQFACDTKIKPNATEQLEAFTTFPPSRIVNANTNASGVSEKVIINRVEYADKGVWQREDWHAPDQLPSVNNAQGRCRLF